MGLAVTAYRSLRFVEAASQASLRARGTDHPLIDDRDHVLLLVADEPYRARMGGMLEGFYAVAGEGADRRFTFSAGPYSTYNRWRERLAALVGVAVVEVWNGTRPAPAFGELIDFSDCEGAIGGAVCTRLAADFGAWEERACVFAETLEKYERREFLPLYRCWRHAFEVAADGGAVRFH